ncbi:hypothetical protein O3M35_011402 [Rhynocoris fuscipes]|uniref:Triokinase/FMN cyclase n=1 Tax=Rhynocoris fuscipes TaxID=488301 RepID=A0AAW1D0M0_9HEMI
MLTAAVYGDMNGTPTPNHILTALRELNNPNGVIMIVRNDLADRLNFGLAMERARADGIPVEMVTVTDDCWESQENPVGRRCLSGIIPVIKIAGAMSEKRKTMTDIYLMCRGLSITSISTVYPVESYAKIGSNLKGQGGKVLGKKEIPEVVREMVTCMIDEKKYFSTSIYPLNKFIVLINCYKFDKMLMGLLTNLLFHELGKAGVCIERLYSGTFISGPMSGYSFTLVKDIDEELLEYIDFRVPSRAWPLNPATVPKVRQKTFFRRPSYEPGPICGITLLNGPRNNPIFRRYCEECITAACRAIIAEEFHINRLDPEETYGSLVTVGARELLEQVSKGKLNYDWPYILMSQLSDILENCILGGIGTLYGLFFSGIALNLLSYASSVCLDFEQWVFAIKQGINAMASMAHFRVDDCTLLDALYPFYKALLPEDSNKFFLDRLRDAVTAASLGADRTALIKSKRHNLRSPEPGAKTVVTILQAIYDTTKRLYETDLDNEMDPNNIPCPIGIVELVEEPKYIVSEEIVAELCEDYEPETILYPEDELNEMMESTGITESDLPSMTEE